MTNKITFQSSIGRLLNNRARQKGALLLLFMLFSLVGQAQIAVTVTGKDNTTPSLAATYTSFASALTDLNAVTAMTGPVTLTLTGSETAPPAGFTLGSSSLNSAVNNDPTKTITITGSATLNAGVGVATPALAAPNNIPDGILKLVGTDYVTIDRLTFTDSNTTNPQTMEFGLALFRMNATDGCQHNTIQNCVFNMQNINNTTGTAPWPSGANGIVSVNSTPVAPATNLSATAASGSNSFNQYYHNTINGGNIGITLKGYADVSPFTFADWGNDVGGNTQATGNSFLNFGGGLPSTSTSINSSSQYDLNFSYNIIDNTAVGLGQGGSFTAVTIGSATSASCTISYNDVKLIGGQTTATVTAISNVAGGTAANNTIRINNNNIHDCKFDKFTTGTFTGILSNTTAANNNINNNTFANNTIGIAATANVGTMTAIANGTNGAAAQSCTINNNIITNNSVNSQGGTFNGISTRNHSVTCDGNLISGIFFPNVTTSKVSIYPISNSYTSATTITENFTNNTISDIIVTGGSANTQASQIWAISNLKQGTTNSANIHHNIIRNFSTALGVCDIRGIAILSGQTDNVYNNKISDITATAAAGTALKINGLFASTCTTLNVYNNIIGNLSLPNSSSTSSLVGMSLANTGAIANLNLYNNTVYLNATSTATPFGSKIVTLNSGTNVTSKNNIFVNNSNSVDTGKSIVIEMTGVGTASGNLAKYIAASNNLLHGATIYTDTAATPNFATSLTDFKTLLADTRESGSIDENPSFTSTTGTDNTFLNINTNVLTSIDGAGTPIILVTEDFDGNIRNTKTPDIGADEFEPAKKLVVHDVNVCSPATTINLTAASVTEGSSSDLILSYYTDEALTTVVITPTAVGTGKYYIKATHATLTGSAVKAVNATINPLPVVQITNPAAVCAPATVDITLPAVTDGSDSGLTYTYWTNALATTEYATPTAATNGTYYIKGTNTTTSCYDIKPVTVIVNPVVPVPTLGTVTQPTCTTATGSFAITNYNASYTYTVTPSTGVTTSAGTVTAPAGTYTVTATSGNCTSVASTNATVNAQPLTPVQPTLGTVTQPTCTTATGSFTITNYNASYTYAVTPSTGVTTSAGTVTAPVGTYTVTATSGNCTSAASTNATVNAQPSTPVQPTLGTVTQPTCTTATGSFTITNYNASYNYTVTPSTGVTTSAGTVTAPAGTYAVTATSGNCTSAASTNATVNAQPLTPVQPTLGTITQPTCTTATGSFTITNYNASYTYTVTPSTGVTTSAGTVTAPAGTYTVTATSGNCTSAPSTNATVNTQPSTPVQPTLGTVTQPTCTTATGSFTITNYNASYTYTVTPSTGVTTSAGTVTAPAGTYTVTATSGNCTSAASINATVNAQPLTPVQPTLGTVTQPTCTTTTGSFTITNYNASYAYAVTPSTGVTTSSGTVTAPAGTYTVTAISGNCTSAASANKTVNAQPQIPSVLSVSNVIQPGCTTLGAVTLSGLPSGNWTVTQEGAVEKTYTGSTSTYNVSGLVPGTFGFKVTNEGGCTSVLSQQVTINSAPQVLATPTVGTIAQPTCLALGSVALSNLPSSGDWTIVQSGTKSETYPGSGFTFNVIGLTKGTYTFVVTSSGSCNSLSSTVVTINDLPNVPAPTGDATQTFNQGATVGDIIVDKAPNGTINWYKTEADALAGTDELSLSATLVSNNYYAVQEIDGCTSVPFVVNVNITLGVNQFDMTGLRYYPNPVKGELNILYNHEMSSIELFNLLGQNIMTVRPNAVNAKVDMTNLPIGTYLLQVSSEGKSAMIKVIKNQ